MKDRQGNRERTDRRKDAERTWRAEDHARQLALLRDLLQACSESSNPRSKMWGEAVYLGADVWHQLSRETSSWMESYPLGNTAYAEHWVADCWLGAAKAIQARGMLAWLRKQDPRDADLPLHLKGREGLLARTHDLFLLLVQGGEDVVTKVTNEVAAVRRDYEPNERDFKQAFRRAAYPGLRWDMGRYFDLLIEKLDNAPLASVVGRLRVRQADNSSATGLVWDQDENGVLEIGDSEGMVAKVKPGLAGWAFLSVMKNHRGEVFSLDELAHEVDMALLAAEGTAEEARARLRARGEATGDDTYLRSQHHRRGRRALAYTGLDWDVLVERATAAIRAVTGPKANQWRQRWIHWDRGQGTLYFGILESADQRTNIEDPASS